MDDTIVITDANNKKHTLAYTGTDIYKLYGKDVNALYDTKNKKILTLEVAADNATVSGTVTKVESKNIYIKKVAYALPKSGNIKLVSITDLSDAEEAYVTTKNGTVTHVLAIGKEDLYVGIATAKSTKSNNKYRVTLLDIDGGKDTFVLADQSLTINKNDVVIYALNSDDELVLRYKKAEKDGLQVESVSKTELKLKGKTKYTVDSSNKPVIIEVEDGEITERSSLTYIDEKYDSALMIESSSKVFVIYFVDGLDESSVDDENASATKTAAKKRLNAAIKDASSKKEASYSIVTYERMLTKLEAAENINQSTASIATMDKASLALETAIENLEKATTADKTLRADFASLTAKIKEAKTLAKNTEYTEESRNALTKVITTAEKITITTTTSAKVKAAIENLQNAIDDLVSTATEAEIAEIKAEIEALLKVAKAKVENNYTKESFDKLKEAIAAAEAITDYTKERISKLTNISNNLTTALNNLVSFNSQNFDNAKKNYKTEKAKVDQLNKDDYTAKSWAEVQKYVVDIDEEYKDITEATMPRAISEIETLTNNLKAAIEDLTYTEEHDAKEALSATITKAKKIESTDWSADEDITFTAFQTIISDAEKLVNSSSATIQQLEESEAQLKTYIRKYL